MVSDNEITLDINTRNRVTLESYIRRQYRVTLGCWYVTLGTELGMIETLYYDTE